MPRWNAHDGDIDRTSHDFNEPTTYEVLNKYPLNPRGRTGLRGRGRLGRWGPNHAADAVLTRYGLHFLFYFNPRKLNCVNLMCIRKSVIWIYL